MNQDETIGNQSQMSHPLLLAYKHKSWDIQGGHVKSIDFSYYALVYVE